MKGSLLSLLCVLAVVCSATAAPADGAKPKIVPPKKPPPHVVGPHDPPPAEPAAADAPDTTAPPVKAATEASADAPVTESGGDVAAAAADVDDNTNTLRTSLVAVNSFTPPFDEYDEATGERVIHDAWKTGGDTDVHENFVRLTNDRQSKVGG
jgi:hypothetical protein